MSTCQGLLWALYFSCLHTVASSSCDALSGSCNREASDAEDGNNGISLIQTHLHLSTGLSKAHADTAGASDGSAALETLAKRRRDGVRVRQEMENYYNLQYFANISVGNQVFKGILDTGSFELLVIGQQCETCGDVSRGYNYKLSPTYVEGAYTQMHSYGSGDMYTFEGWDDVRLGDLFTNELPFLQANNLTFWEVIWANMPLLLPKAQFQAIIGMGPPELPSLEAHYKVRITKENNEFLTQLIGEDRAGKLEQKLKQDVSQAIQAAKNADAKETLIEALGVDRFSVCLMKRYLEPGFFVWNDYDPKEKLDMFTQVPVCGEHTWSATVDNVILEGDHWQSRASLGCGDGCGALVDSGTSLLLLPSSIISAMVKVLNQYNADCKEIDRFPDLKFKLGGKDVFLPPTVYLGKIFNQAPSPIREDWFPEGGAAYDTVCKLQLMVGTIDVNTNYGPMIILGMPFFRHYYTTFELGDYPEYKSTQRSMYIALADDQCEPAQPDKAASSFARHSPLLELDASKMHRPLWQDAMKRNKTIRL